MDEPYRSERANENNTRYQSLFPLKGNRDDYPIQFKYLEGDYKTYRDRSFKYDNSLFGHVIVLKNLALASLGLIFLVSLTILHGLRAPFIGSDLAKLYAYYSVRAMEMMAGDILFFVNGPLGSYLIDEAYSHMKIYEQIHEDRLAEQNFACLQ